MYPQLEKHKVKEGKNVYLGNLSVRSQMWLYSRSNCERRNKRQGSIEELGMADLSKEHKKWDRLGDDKKWLSTMILMTAKMMMMITHNISTGSLC